MPVHNIGGIFIRVRNLDKSIEFYTKQLGLEIRNLEEWDGVRQANLNIGDNRLSVTLIEQEQVQVIEHPIFNLISSNIAEMYDSFKQKGYEVSDLEQWKSEVNHHLMFDIRDPDGHALNIIEIHPIQGEAQAV